jgi:hypothetical protein
MLREMPSIMAEAMQSMTPIITKYADNIKQTLLKETDDMIAQSKKRSGSPASNN